MLANNNVHGARLTPFTCMRRDEPPLISSGACGDGHVCARCIVRRKTYQKLKHVDVGWYEI